MKPKSRGYELDEYTAEIAEKDNFEWWSSLSPSRKIRAIEAEVKGGRMLKSLKKVESREIE